jgi:hypothetical protein
MRAIKPKDYVAQKYCRKCGKELIEKKGKPFYDGFTGQKVVVSYYMCPSKDIDAFFRENKIEKDEYGTWNSITDKQRKQIDKFWENNHGHTNFIIKRLI